MIVRVPDRMVGSMIDRFFGRRVAALIVALGVILSGTAPAWAMPAAGNGSKMAVTMPGMAMDTSCMEMGKAAPGKQVPTKSSDASCGACISCAPNIALVLDLVPLPILHQYGDSLIGADANPDGIASPPALPPPILRA